MQEPRFNAIDADTVELISDQGGSHRGRRDLKVRNLTVDGTQTVATFTATTATITTAVIAEMTSPRIVGSGALYVPIRAVTALNVTVASTDHTLLADTTSNAITFALPALAAEIGRMLVFKKTINNANNVVLDPSGAETIDGAASLTFNSYQTAFTIQAQATGWFVISAY